MSEREIVAKLHQAGHATIACDAENGMARTMSLCGTIRNSDPRFNGKEIHVVVGFPAEPGWDGDLKRRDGVENSVGIARISANVDAQQERGQAPVEVWLVANKDLFDAIYKQAVDAYERRQALWSRIRLVGTSSPCADADSTLFGPLFHTDLDRLTFPKTASTPFWEHEIDVDTTRLPRIAPAGEFEYRPESRYFLLRLRHVPDDVPRLILPTLRHSNRTRVTVFAVLSNAGGTPCSLRGLARRGIFVQHRSADALQ